MHLHLQSSRAQPGRSIPAPKSPPAPQQPSVAGAVPPAVPRSVAGSPPAEHPLGPRPPRCRARTAAVHTAKELERSQDDALILIRAALAKVAERIKGMDADELAAGQIPAALRTLIELEFKVLGYEDRVALTGKDGGPVKTKHVFQPSPEVWDDILRTRAEFERLRDGDTDEDTASDSL